MPGDYDIEYASPWAGANVLPVGAPGSALQKFEKETWPELDRICREVPEAGIHFQETIVYGRKKDEGSVTGQWFAELVKEDAWFRGLLPNVSPSYHLFLFISQFRFALNASNVRLGSCPSMEGTAPGGHLKSFIT